MSTMLLLTYLGTFVRLSEKYVMYECPQRINSCFYKWSNFKLILFMLFKNFFFVTKSLILITVRSAVAATALAES